MTGSSRKARVAAFAAALTLAAAAPAGASHATPSPGSAGIGDVLFPTLGNGGCDAGHYSLALRYPTGAPGETVQGRVTMYARATQALSRFDLDFSGDSVGSVSVDGRPAGWRPGRAASSSSPRPGRCAITRGSRCVSPTRRTRSRRRRTIRSRSASSR